MADRIRSKRRTTNDVRITAAGTPRRWLAGLMTDWERLLFFGFAGLIAVVAFALRSYDLDRNPPELFEDELSGIVGVWSIVTTGHDIEKTWLPFVVTRLEFKQPIYFVATVLPHALFGPQAWAMRLPAVLFGVTSAVLVISLLRRVFGRPRAEALIAGALFATVPWAVHYGRIAWEPAAFIPFGLAGIGLLWLGLAEDRPRFTLAAAVTMALGAYTYHPALLMNAVLAVVILLLNWRTALRQWVVLGGAAVIAGVILLPYARAYLSEPLFTYRHDLVTIFKAGVTPDAIGLGWRNYAEQWNPQWLFLEGDRNLRNHPGVALMFGWLAPFLLLGIARTLARPGVINAFLLAWLILGPLPAGITNDGVPHFTRGIFAMPPLLMLTASGLIGAHEWSGQRNRAAAIGLAAAIAFIALNQALAPYRYYFTEYPVASGPWWYYGARSAMELTRVSVPRGGTVCIETPLPIPYLTFQHYMTYYLPGRSFQVVEGLQDPICSRSGSYLVHRLGTDIPRSSRSLGTITAQNGTPIYGLSIVR